MLKGLGVPYAIIRPTPVFGDVDLLLNKMAWELRRLPVFPVHESDNYLVRPVYVEDLAAQSVQAGSQSENSIAGTAGPDTFSFEELLRLLGSKMGIRVAGTHAAAVGPRPDSNGWLAEARHGAHPRRGCWTNGRVADVRQSPDRQDQAGLTGSTTTRTGRQPVSVRTAAQSWQYGTEHFTS